MNGVLDRLENRFFRYPPRRFRLAEYQRWFPKTARIFLRTLRRSGALPVLTARHRPKIGLVVMPWVSTAPPWYAIMLGIGFARRGRQVVLLWDDTWFPDPRLDEQNRAIGRVLSYVGEFFPVVRLSEQPAAATRDHDRQAIDALTAQNVQWFLRGARSPGRRYSGYEADVRRALESSLPLVRAAIGTADLDCLVVCGGIYGSSGLFRLAGAEVGCRVATYDADVNVAQVCVDGVASQCQDVPRAFTELWNRGVEEQQRAIEIALAEYEMRVEGRDRYGFQSVPGNRENQRGRGSVLIPLNVEWDSSALGKHTHFADSADWIVSTIGAVLESDGATVIVRQHPSERRELQASRFDVGKLIRRRFGENPRIRFVAAGDPVSTYDLLDDAQLVLPFVSTIGIEAAGLGKPVLVAGSSYYADLGFVRRATSREEYFDLLRRGIRGDLEPLPQQVERAWVCYYLTAVRNRVWTDFTPQPKDFWKWCRRQPDELLDDPAVADMIEAIDRDVPISLLRHDKARRSTHDDSDAPSAAHGTGRELSQ